MNVTVLKPNPYESNQLAKSVMSNFDHAIDEDVAQELQKTKAYAHYPGWDFSGQVWWDRKGKQWCCGVWVYKRHVETMYAVDLRELMTEVSDKYGWD